MIFRFLKCGDYAVRIVWIEIKIKNIKHQKYTKIDYEGEKTVGRLYCRDSIQTLPREIRYFVFKDDYVDLDIANAHPSILWLYSKKHDLSLNGSLAEYVINRDTVMSKIQQEFLIGKKEDITRGEVKKHVLKLLNKTWSSNSTTASSTLNALDSDFQAIRNHLWDSYCRGELENHRPALENSMSRKKDNYTLEDGTVDDDKFILLQKISLQSFYCQTQETVHLTSLIEFLREKYLVYLERASKTKFIDYYPYIDKTVNLGAQHTLCIVPFFDGLYISSPNRKFMHHLNDQKLEF